MSTPVDESLVALIGLLSFVLVVAVYVWTALALAAMFRKMGEDAWKGWVPLLNVGTVLKWGGFSPWLVLLTFVPVAGPIVVAVLVIVSAHRINPGFGYGGGMTVLAALLFVVWASILGFGPARWLGARVASRTLGRTGGSGGIARAGAGGEAGAGGAAGVPGAATPVARVVGPATVVPGVVLPSDAPTGVATGAATGAAFGAALGQGESGDGAAVGASGSAEAASGELAGVADGFAASGGSAGVTGAASAGARSGFAASAGAASPGVSGGFAGADAGSAGRDGGADAVPPVGAADAAAFAPPSAGTTAWTPPETAPRPASAAVNAAPGASAAGAPSPASAAGAASAAGGVAASETPAPAAAAPTSAAAGVPAAAAVPGTSVPAATSAASALDSDPITDASWPSEIDDVSAIHPSPFPPSSAAGRPYVGPTVGDEGPIAFVPGRRGGSDPVVPPAPVNRVPAVPARGEAPVAASVPERAAPVEPPQARPARSTRVDPEADAPVATSEPASASSASASSASGAAAAPASAAAGSGAQPLRARRTFDPDDADGFPEMSGEVSAVVGSPVAGAPRSAAAAVSAQHRRIEEGEPLRANRLDDDLDDDDALDVTVIARRSIRATWELVPASGSPIPLTAAVVILGRRPAGDPAFPTAQLVAVQDDARTVSKTHARLEQRGESWVVTDLGSTNGVLVRTLMGDEVEVEPGGQLDAGERFFLGDEEFHLRRIDR